MPRVPAIGLDRHSGQRRLDVTGLHEHRLKSRFGETRIEPLRQWTGLEADPGQRKAKALEELYEPGFPRIANRLTASALSDSFSVQRTGAPALPACASALLRCAPILIRSTC